MSPSRVMFLWLPQRRGAIGGVWAGLSNAENAGDLRSVASAWSRGYRADRNAMASTASHATITKEATAPAVILAFSLVV
jgi:hypothetical protein